MVLRPYFTEKIESIKHFDLPSSAFQNVSASSLCFLFSRTCPFWSASSLPLDLLHTNAYLSSLEKGNFHLILQSTLPAIPYCLLPLALPENNYLYFTSHSPQPKAWLLLRSFANQCSLCLTLIPKHYWCPLSNTSSPRSQNLTVLVPSLYLPPSSTPGHLPKLSSVLAPPYPTQKSTFPYLTFHFSFHYHLEPPLYFREWHTLSKPTHPCSLLTCKTDQYFLPLT